MSKAYDRATEFFNKAFDELGIEDGEYDTQDKNKKSGGYFNPLEHSLNIPYMEHQFHTEPRPVTRGAFVIGDTAYRVMVSEDFSNGKVIARAVDPITETSCSFIFDRRYLECDETFFFDIVIPKLKKKIINGDIHATPQ